MIIKQYVLYCDKCGRYISTIETSAIEKAVRIEKRSGRNAKITKKTNGVYRIKCVDCRKDKPKKESANTIYMERCPKCGKENWAPAVASGQCAWCGYKAKEADVNGGSVFK